MNEWQPIETLNFEDLPFWTSEVIGPETKYYEGILVYGPTWEGDWHQSPYSPDKGGGWTGSCTKAIATTWTGRGFWTVDHPCPGDYEEYIKPTHWMPLPNPPADT